VTLFLLDTNVVSEWVKPRPDPHVVTWLSEANEDDIYLSVCTLAELRFGIASMPDGKRRSGLDRWLRDELVARFDGRIVPIDAAVADAWGVLHARAKAAGRSIDTMDGLIAATAAIHQMTVVTRDVSAFRAAGLSPFNPWRPGG
jgi:predicted nucleic acid-binding protein